MVYNRPVNAVYMNLPGLKCIDSGKAFNERGFPGPVFSYQRMDFSFPLRVIMARSLLMAAEDGFCKTACFE